MSGGIRRPGIRMGHQKYQFTKFDETYKSANLVKPTGGAILCKTQKCIVIGIWNKEATSSNGKIQNVGDATIQVEDMATYLRDKGF